MSDLVGNHFVGFPTRQLICFFFFADSRRELQASGERNAHLVLVTCLWETCLDSVVRIFDFPSMTLAVDSGRQALTQPTDQTALEIFLLQCIHDCMFSICFQWLFLNLLILLSSSLLQSYFTSLQSDIDVGPGI